MSPARNTPPVPPWRPTREQLIQAREKRVADVIGKGLRVLFCGINPGLYSAAIGHHFGRPGNRFWPCIYAAGFSPRLLTPFEERELLREGCGITNLVGRATASAEELSAHELQAGAKALTAKVKRCHPRIIAFLSISAYRVAFDRRSSRPGPQGMLIGATRVWVLPNPSGLNAHYQFGRLTELFRELREAAELG